MCFVFQSFVLIFFTIKKMSFVYDINPSLTVDKTKISRNPR